MGSPLYSSEPVTSFEYFDSNGDGVLDVFAINRNASSTQNGVKIWNGADLVANRAPMGLGAIKGPVYAVAQATDIDGNLAFIVAGENAARLYNHDLSSSTSIPNAAMKIRQLKVIPSIGKYAGLVQTPAGGCGLLSAAGVCLMIFQPDMSSFSIKGLVDANPLGQRSLAVSGASVYVAQTTGNVGLARLDVDLGSESLLQAITGRLLGPSVALFDIDADNVEDRILQTLGKRALFNLSSYANELVSSGSEVQYFVFKDPSYVRHSGPSRGVNQFYSVSVEKRKITIEYQTLDCSSSNFDMNDAEDKVAEIKL